MCTWGCWAYFSLSFSAYWRATRSLSFMTPSFSLARAFHSRRHISSLPLTTYCSRKMCRQTPVATIQLVGTVERCKTIINCKKWVKYPIGSSQNEVTTKKCTSAPEQVFTIKLFRLLFKITLPISDNASEPILFHFGSGLNFFCHFFLWVRSGSRPIFCLSEIPKLSNRAKKRAPY